MHMKAEADIKNTNELMAHITHFLLCNTVICCYEGMKSESHQAPLGMTLTSTLVNNGGFIMMNVANMKRMSPLLIDFQLCLENMIIEDSKCTWK